MTSNKRKCRDQYDQSSNGPAVVVVPSQQNGDESFCGQGLHKINLYLSTEDPLLEAIENISEGANGPINGLDMETSNIKSTLEQELEQELDACKLESRVLVDLEGRVEKMKLMRNNLVEEMERLDKTQIRLQRNISKFQEESSHEIDSIDKVEEEQKRLVPRLKTQISLYASTTGIRWDFAQDEILSGQVAIAKTKTLQSFCIDPRDYSPVETANRLWKMIDVGE